MYKQPKGACIMKKHLMTAAMATGLILTAFGASASADGNTYTVQSGDSLWKISQSYHVTVDQLKTWNQLSSDTIYVNQNLLIVPPASAPAPSVTSEATVSYTVKAGDTLYALAKTFGTTVSDIKSINGLTADLIQIGQQLKIPTTTATTSAPVVTVPSVSKAEAVIDEAKKYIGVPYLWGGSTQAGFDCSGLVNYVFNKVGVSVPRTVATLWAAEQRVSVPNPGDLVFFDINQTGTATHVGIYTGDNKFIHAGSTGVTISDMTLTYWKTRYMGAKTAL
jgi:cell wall-associated NlpC family hydrolase